MTVFYVNEYRLTQVISGNPTGDGAIYWFFGGSASFGSAGREIYPVYDFIFPSLFTLFMYITNAEGFTSPGCRTTAVCFPINNRINKNKPPIILAVGQK